MNATATLARIEARGHPAIRLNHDASIELAEDAEITARATCVAGVAAQVTDGSIEGLAGPVRLLFRIQGTDVPAEIVDGTANPRWQPGGGMVVRASHNRLPDTLVTGATCTARGFSEAWRAAAASPEAKIDVEVQRLPAAPHGRRTVVLAHWPRDVPADPDVAAWLRTGHPRWEVDGQGPGREMPDGPVVVVVGRDRWPGVVVSDVVAAAQGDEIAWEVLGLPAELAVACLLGGDAPIALAAHGAGRDTSAAALAQVDTGWRTVVTLPAARARKVLEGMAGTPVPGMAVAIAVDAGRSSCRYLRGSIEDCSQALRDARHAVCMGLLRVPGDGGAVAPRAVAGVTDPALVRALLAGGVPARTIIDALAARPGARRNAVQAFVRDLAGDTSGAPGGP